MSWYKFFYEWFFASVRALLFPVVYWCEQEAIEFELLS